MIIEVYDMITGKKIERADAEKISQKYFGNRCLIFSFAHSANNTIYNSRMNKIFKAVDV